MCETPKFGLQTFDKQKKYARTVSTRDKTQQNMDTLYTESFVYKNPKLGCNIWYFDLVRYFDHLKSSRPSEFLRQAQSTVWLSIFELQLSMNAH